MDKYYGNVCELDIIFNFQKAYFILDELLLAGELQESSKKNVLRCIGQQDSLEDMEVSDICISTKDTSRPNSLPINPGLGLLTLILPSGRGRYRYQDYVVSCWQCISYPAPAQRIRGPRGDPT